MLQSQRVIHGSTDISTKVNDYRSGAYTFDYDVGQYLYVGSELPFNNLYFDIGTPNALSGTTASVDIWFGNAWVPAVDVVDETKPASTSLAQDGRINFSTNRLKGWDPEQDSADVTGLSGTYIYNMYWARFSWSANLTDTTTIKYMGQKFANDTDLYSFYPDLNNSTLQAAFAVGKADWDEQHFTAAEEIVRDLKAKNIIKSRAQILDWQIFQTAACHKAAEIIYRGLGPKQFEANLNEARDDYKAAMKLSMQHVDLNASGNLEPYEKCVTTGFTHR